MLPLRLNSFGRFTASTACAPARALVTGARTVEAVCCGFCCNWARAGARAVETARFGCFIYLCPGGRARSKKCQQCSCSENVGPGGRARSMFWFVCLFLFFVIVVVFVFDLFYL